MGDEELLEYVIEKDFEDSEGRIILETVKRFKDGIGRVRLSRLLRGSDPGFVIDVHPEARDMYGRLELLSLDQITDFIESLIRLGGIEVDGVDFPRLTITKKGIRALRSDSLIPAQIPWPLPPREVPIPGDLDLYLRLKEERNRMAREEGMPPYCVATNINLVNMVNGDIEDETDIANIKGMGRARAEKYGPSFLELMGKA